MPTHNPSRKRYIRPNRIKTKVVERYVSDLPMVATEACLLDATMVTTKAVQRRLEDVASLLWSENYEEIMEREKEELANSGMLLKALELKAAAPPSTYTSRGK